MTTDLSPEKLLAFSANLTTTRLVKYMAKNKINSDTDRAIFIDRILHERYLFFGAAARSNDETDLMNLESRIFLQRLLRESRDHSNQGRFLHIKHDLKWLYQYLLFHAKKNGYITEVKKISDVQLLWIGKLHNEGNSRDKISDQLALLHDYYGYPFIKISTDIKRYIRERLSTAQTRYREYLVTGGSEQLFEPHGLKSCVWLPTFVY